MNYRHAFHAGNFADVLKHLVLSRCIEHLKRKEKAFRVIDTHAGIGQYDLSSDEAQRTGEWRNGIGRLMGQPIAPDAEALAAPFLQVVRGLNGNDTLETYPGSPMVTRSLLRPQDRLTAIELHPEDGQTLKARFAGDWQVRIIALDGWLALGAHVPPKEKRGLVLVDPPFEKPDEFDRMLEGLSKAVKRWRGGTFALWYPIKDRGAVHRFRQGLRDGAFGEGVDISLFIREPSGPARLDGCGMAVVNPPYTLEAEMALILPEVGRLLSEDGTARVSIETF
ncbi:23S rRNA (adenine(2030)-N(6))-methyltransferase RlmJ [Notoacmeibacter ruber]|uniref:Ribosomal RNA large subunit methyltransferase J n=1 Tax=Notoacmeibacter ruber TaxID=2670375 RepID=A0A3L7JGQ2_9HYPH|nr:23S rRNA (adenine(2030)-N(6))-methyltransferase RlmJ [Notoacmeibacter ruber]RLQ87662.1 23S rRNA (adenine(2030)-N(6))-methyltransferase RlmJ [Notoacmeibacter ruber]